MSTVTELRPRAAPPRLLPQPAKPARASEGAFWCAALGGALEAMAALAPHLETVAAGIGHLPDTQALARPAAGAYLGAIQALARSWQEQQRPRLHEALQALGAVAAMLSHGAGRKGQQRPRAVGPALVKRMTLAVTVLERLSETCENELGRMAHASGELDADTLQLSERLQADQVHALLLSQQASTLQAKLDDATMRQHAYWLLGPHAEQIRQEIAMHNSAREGVRRQLDQLRAEQAAMQAEARYLQHLLPSLSSYLAGLDRFGAAARAALAGSGALLAQWEALHSGSEQLPPPAAARQLSAAAPCWAALGATAAAMLKGQRRTGLRTPDGYRT